MFRRYSLESNLSDLGFVPKSDRFVQKEDQFLLTFHREDQQQQQRLDLYFRGDTGELSDWIAFGVHPEGQEAILQAILEATLTPLLKRLALYGLIETFRKENEGELWVEFEAGPELVFNAHTGTFLFVDVETEEFPLDTLIQLAE